MKELPPCTGAAGGRIALPESRRDFLKMSSLTAGALLLSPMGRLSGAGTAIERSQSDAHAGEAVSADYALHIQASAIEIAPKRIISLVTYNGQFPGPLLRFKEGRQDRKSTRLNSSHQIISYAAFSLKKKKHHIPVAGGDPRLCRIAVQDPAADAGPPERLITAARRHVRGLRRVRPRARSIHHCPPAS